MKAFIWQAFDGCVINIIWKIAYNYNLVTHNLEMDFAIVVYQPSLILSLFLYPRFLHYSIYHFIEHMHDSQVDMFAKRFL